MGDTLSIKEAVEQATSTLNKEATEESTPEVVEEKADDVEQSTEGDTPEETQEPKAESKDDKPVDEETDFEHIDPKTLPKELQGVYKNLLKGFTQGRQKDSERAKRAEEELAKAKVETNKPTEEMPKFNTPEEYYAYVAEKTAKETIKNERVSAYRDEASKEYPKLDPRLDDKNIDTYDKVFDQVVGAELDVRLGKYIQEKGTELGFDYKAEFKSIKEDWDDYVNGSVKKYIQKQSELAKQNESKLRKATPKTSTGQVVPSGIKSVGDAIRAAQEKLNNK
jgi:hypothetical protein